MSGAGGACGKCPFFWRWNVNSALLEIALCIMAYVVVLWIEMSPYLLERYQDSDNLTPGGFLVTHCPSSTRRRSVIALGLLPPTMHQSSLGTLMLLANSRLHELWRTPLVPLFFPLTCVSAATRSSSSRRLSRASRSAAPDGDAGRARRHHRAAAGRRGALRLVDPRTRGVIGSLFTGDVRSLMLLLELVLFLVPVAMLMAPASRNTQSRQSGPRGDGDDVRRRTSTASTSSSSPSTPAPTGPYS